MPPLPTTAQVMHRELPAGRLARSSCCWGAGWGEAGHDLLHHCKEATPFRALEGPGIQWHFSQGRWPPGKRRTRHKKHGPLLGPSTHPGPRGRGLTEIELHEAEGWSEVLQATPLALVEVSGVQEEGDVGQKEILEPG